MTTETEIEIGVDIPVLEYQLILRDAVDKAFHNDVDIEAFELVVRDVCKWHGRQRELDAFFARFSAASASSGNGPVDHALIAEQIGVKTGATVKQYVAVILKKVTARGVEFLKADGAIKEVAAEKIAPVKKGGPQKRVKDHERIGIQVLVDSGISPSEISKLTGLHKKTIYAISKEERPHPVEQARGSSLIRRELAVKQWNLVDVVTDLMMEKGADGTYTKLGKMNAFQLSGIKHYGVQDARLLSGESTENVAMQMKVSGNMAKTVHDATKLWEEQLRAESE